MVILKEAIYREGLSGISKMINFIKVLIIIFVIFAGFYFAISSLRPGEVKEFGILYIGGVGIKAEVVRTEEDHARGLSGRKSLGEREGMFFIYDRENFYGIWMKEMQFPIDIIWINRNWEVVGLEQKVSPLTYPNIFNSAKPAQYIVEVNSGFAKSYDIKVGTRAEFTPHLLWNSPRPNRAGTGI